MSVKSHELRWRKGGSRRSSMRPRVSNGAVIPLPTQKSPQRLGLSASGFRCCIPERSEHLMQKQ
ncbi:hypothetical protein BD413DRAFT_2986 [Trametes elegans]|nr:hypothetical protein BD413DRAFT_2986 [Trametes elegans]